jgi:hypothetical protein
MHGDMIQFILDVRKRLWKGVLDTTVNRRKANVKLELRKVGFKSVGRIKVAQDIILWWVRVNVALNFHDS